MKPQADLEALLGRHSAFWRRQPVERPLVRVRTERVPFHDTVLSPERLDTGLLTPQAWEGLVQGDLFRKESAFGAIPWMEAITGCEIHVGVADVMWAKPTLDERLEHLQGIVPDESNPWLRKLIALTARLVETNTGNFLVTHTLQRGPSDMLCALLGPERMGLAFYDQPEKVHRVLALVTEAFLRVTRAQYELIPPFHGGWGPWGYGVWAPGTTARVQSDASVAISRDMYREFILPCDRAIFETFEFSLIDLHSGGTLSLYPALLEEPALGAISVTLDRHEHDPSVQDLLPAFREILERKSLIVFGEMTDADVETLVAELPAAGLCVDAIVRR